LVRGLLRRVDTDDFGIGDRGYEDGGLEDFERARIVETSEAGKSMLFDPSDVSTQAARRLVTLWRRVDTLDEITQGW